MLTLEAILTPQDLQSSLRCLVISSDNELIADIDTFTSVLQDLPKLRCLGVPFDLMRALFVLYDDTITDVAVPLPLKQLTVLPPCNKMPPEEVWADIQADFFLSLRVTLPKLLLLKVHSMIGYRICHSYFDKYNERILGHLDTTEDEELDELVIDNVGFEIYE